MKLASGIDVVVISSGAGGVTRPVGMSTMESSVLTMVSFASMTLRWIEYVVAKFTGVVIDVPEMRPLL